MNEFVENLKTQAEENPFVALAVCAGLLTAASKFIKANTDAKNAKAWAKEVDRRVKKSKQ